MTLIEELAPLVIIMFLFGSKVASNLGWYASAMSFLASGCPRIEVYWLYPSSTDFTRLSTKNFGGLKWGAPSPKEGHLYFNPKSLNSYQTFSLSSSFVYLSGCLSVLEGDSIISKF